MAKAEINIELRNGKASVTEAVKTPEGVVYGSLSAPGEYAAVIARHLPDAESGAGGIFVIVPDGAQAGKISVNNIIDKEGRYATRSVVIAGENAGVELSYGQRSVDGAELSDSRTVVAGGLSRIHIEEAFGDKGSLAVDSVSYQDAGSRVETVSVVPGADACTRVSYLTKLRGGEAEAVHSGLFFAAGKEKVDYSVRVEHLVPDCRSDVTVKGVAADESRGSFTGFVYVAQDAQHTEAYQQSRNLLLSDTAQILTSPQLEIYADDVRCSHGATVGQMNDDAVYYMRQRGLSEEQARGLQLAGFVNDMLLRVEDETRRAELSEFAGRKLGNSFM